MHSESPSRVSRPDSFRRMGIIPFFVLLLVPILLLLSSACIVITYQLNDIRKQATDTNRKYLPGILATQRTLVNIENMRRNAATIYSTQDPRLRRNALIDALALASESVFEPNSDFASHALKAEPLFRSLAETKTRSDKAADRLHSEELRFSNANGRLLLRAGLPNALHIAHSAQHLSSDMDVKRDTAHYEQIQKLLEPLQALCREAPPGDRNFREDCDQFEKSWNTLVAVWQQRVSADHEATALWSQLDELLRKLSNDASTFEAERVHQTMELIQAEARHTRTSFLIAILLFAGTQIVFVAAIHHFILAPLTLASRDLHSIRSGLSTKAIPPVRLRELQNLLDLLPSLSHYLTEVTARSSQLEKEKEQYANLSMHDALTGVYNRRSFDEQLAQKDHNDPMALLMLDVDLFKLYNDTYGHQAGDDALAAVAHAMKQALLRGTDKVFRYGGEEFTVLLPNATEKAALAVAERIQRNVRALALPHPSSSVAPALTVSIGVALRAPGARETNEDLVTRTDKALYQAKNSGRDRICLYRPEDEPAARP